MNKLWNILLILACSTLNAQAHRPDLDGTWKLTVSKSSMGSDHPLPNYVFEKIIAIKGNRLTMTNVQANATIVNIALPDSKITTELTLDGTDQQQQMPGSFPGMPPTNVRALGEWQGGTLFIQHQGQVHGGSMTLRERYFLSDDGASLIELIERHGVTGDREQRLVFAKE